MGSLRFIYGPSGSGKSTYAYENLIKRAKAEPKRQFLVIVPDQFTMETQQAFVKMCGGILNIDILSFGRLTHRILQELGQEAIPVLDDTGKCLVLQIIASSMEEQLPVLGRNLRKQGYIHEAKSAISELMQYGISPEKMEDLQKLSKERNTLFGKLRDLQTLYAAFKDYLAGNYITREEKLDVLRRGIPDSAILRESVILFDGFTGFTPIQLYVIGDLMEVCQELIVSLVLGTEADLFAPFEEQSLFYLSQKTALDLQLLAQKREILIEEPVVCNREKDKAELAYLEKNLFRYPVRAYDRLQDSVVLMEMKNPAREAHFTALEIASLVRKKGYEYRQIAVVCGDFASYEPYLKREFHHLEIPFFMDQTSGIRFNPFVETIRSALQLFEKGYSVQAMIEYLHCGMHDMEADDLDLLEDYIRETGVRGYKKWSQPFTRKTRYMDSQDESALNEINCFREKVMDSLSILHGKGKDTVANYVNQLYDFLCALSMEQKLKEMELSFEEEGDFAKAREYAQIYPAVIDMLDQMVLLMGEQVVERTVFREVLEAGFGEIRIGSIPQSVDRIVVGDLERTRLKSVKALFILGLNDGNVPKIASHGGIFSELDREFLSDAGVELAPTSRQQMYSQRLYLYLSLTKPSDYLFMSWSDMDNDGKTIRPSYLVETIREIFPKLTIKYDSDYELTDKVLSHSSGLTYLAQSLREFADYGINQATEQERAVFKSYSGSEDALLLEEAAFAEYREEPISEQISQLLYGEILRTSISQLEAFGTCAYQYFLRYGLGLQEKTLFEINNSDTGNIYHQVLKAFSDQLGEDGLNWTQFDSDYAKETLHKLLTKAVSGYKSGVYCDTARNAYGLNSLEKTLQKTVQTLQYQIMQGEFLPIGFEIPFQQKIKLSQDGEGRSKEVLLRGVIDRVDMAEGKSGFFVRIIDYKSSDKKLNLSDVLIGKSLQLPVYMSKELEKQRALHPEQEVHPAAMLYYHLEDPNVEISTTPDSSTLEQLKRKELRMTGQVLWDEEALRLQDRTLTDGSEDASSDVIPVSLKKDGTPKRGSTVLTEEDMNLVLQHSERVVRNRIEDILSGNIAINPYESGSCEYCPYKPSCPFDGRIPGYEKKSVVSLSTEEVLEQLRLQD